MMSGGFRVCGNFVLFVALVGFFLCGMLLLMGVKIFVASSTWHLQRSGLFGVWKSFQSNSSEFADCTTVYSDAIGSEDAVLLSHDPSVFILSSAPRRTMMEALYANSSMCAPLLIIIPAHKKEGYTSLMLQVRKCQKFH